MRIFLVTLALASEVTFAAGRPWAAQANVESFQWRNQTISTMEQLYQSMRLIERPEDALAFRKAVATMNTNVDFLLGYALGEFENRMEQDRAELLFQLEHPVLGSMFEARRLHPSSMATLGMLVGSGFNPEQIKQARQDLLALTAESSGKVMMEISNKMFSLSHAELLKIIKDEAESCRNIL